VLAVAGAFGRAAALSLFSAPLRPSARLGGGSVAPGLCLAISFASHTNPV